MKYYSSFYVTRQGESWDGISQDFYGTPHRMAELVQANPQYMDLLLFDYGVRLRIPLLEDKSSASLPPWKRGERL